MFKFKDLYVSLGQEISADCPLCSFLGTTACCLGASGPPHWLTPTLTGTLNTPVLTGSFGSLKAYLKAALEIEEAREKAMQENQKPQTVEEVEMLERKLKGALEELRARKAELQQKR